MKNKKSYLYLLLGVLALIVCGVVYFKVPFLYSKVEYTNLADTPDQITNTTVLATAANTALNPSIVKLPQSSNGLEPAAYAAIPISHIQTPAVVKAVYVSSWVAGLAKYRNPIVNLIDTTELNSIVIDIKDSTGRIGFSVTDPNLAAYGSVENRISDIRAVTNLLHSKHIYVIGRIAVFQDPYMTKEKPEWSITKKSDGTVWKDNKGLSFLDPANKNVWDYTVAIAREAYADGFDEINFDYVRYPSDGPIKDIDYHIAPGGTRSDNLEAFFKYLNGKMKPARSATDVAGGEDPAIPISADLFGLTTEATDDMGIGQVWEKALPYFDFIAPMVYPSHYPNGYDGFSNPAEHPYAVISKALTSAVMKTKNANQDTSKIRPWLQDFNLGAVYTDTMIKQEMKAGYDQGVTSWMLWDPKNKYTPSALELEN